MIVEKATGTVRWVGCLALLPLFAIGGVSAADRGSPLVEHVRNINDRFKDVSVATSEGYAPIACASGIEGGAMGVHYVNTKLLSEDVIDITHPQAVMYETTPDGKMALIAVEYITSKGPASLEGLCSISTALQIATASVHSTNFTCGPGRTTHTARSQT